MTGIMKFLKNVSVRLENVDGRHWEFKKCLYTSYIRIGIVNF